jgi:hypothetical protein
MSLICSYAFRGGIWGRGRPLCVRALGTGDEVTHGRARTAVPGGCAFTPRSRALWPLTCGVQDAISLSPFSTSPVRARCPRAEGVGDALVRGVGLPVDAVLLAVPVHCASMRWEPVGGDARTSRTASPERLCLLLTTFPGCFSRLRTAHFGSCMHCSRGPAAERLT